ncbi:MAG: FAD-dependent thymidylate synthase [Candidatus Omnitrophica bacterium]|nr:FAD-dependent thymidylate synthase [Candidatus Omnitrophota bacterium]
MVKVGFLKDDSAILAALGVKVSQTPFEAGSIQDLYEECKEDREGSIALVNEIMAKHRHMILADFVPYAITLEGISRFGAIAFWRMVNVGNLTFGAGIEASLRVVTPNRFNTAAGDLGEMAFECYERAVELGVPLEDARYMLPEGTLTRMIFSAPLRYLAKIAHMLKRMPLPELKEIGEKISTLVGKLGMKVPKETLPTQWEFWGSMPRKNSSIISADIDDIPFVSIDFNVHGSLAMFAQLVRERQALCQIEPLEQIAKAKVFVVPHSFSPQVVGYYKDIAQFALDAQTTLIENKTPEFVYSLLLGQKAESVIHSKGAGVVDASCARSCGAAQWEIRTQFGVPLAEELAKHPYFRKKVGPRCCRENQCLEPPIFRGKCQAFAKTGGKRMNLEDLLKLQKVSSRRIFF